ncbi:unnamed protein product [Meloidogyne enterolobii]|uniref:Uncharacterized protein n=1 Tax=Meloidogyne enterolobii TaxID=390850 RepID=A0ACB1A0P8_MELEN
MSRVEKMCDWGSARKKAGLCISAQREHRPYVLSSFKSSQFFQGIIIKLSVFLTDMSTIHYKIPYLITDQCMTRPEQKEHGSYGLIFERHFSHLCDELLICYPSQLSGNNTRNGIIPSIPYRLREGKKNNVTIKCEQKRKEFCKEAKNENLCSTGKPASTIWHGILITTEQLITFKYSDSDYDYDFLTTISLSITKQR